jgi:hypothetical protein
MGGVNAGIGSNVKPGVEVGLSNASGVEGDRGVSVTVGVGGMVAEDMDGTGVFIGPPWSV